MDRNQAKEFYPILQAFAEGKVIECRTKPSLVEGTDVPNDWTEMKEIEFWNNTEYRIKPEPKYRPFKSQEECWNEMLKHQPFGWVKSKDKGYFRLIGLVQFASELEDVMITFATSENLARSSHSIYENYIFADGTPFGIKVEE